VREPAAFDAYLRRSIVNLSNTFFRRRTIQEQHAVVHEVSRMYLEQPGMDERTFGGGPSGSWAANRPYASKGQERTFDELEC
jgi:hypothetical protein